VSIRSAALLCSVGLECERLREGLEGSAEVVVGGKSGWEGRLEGARVILLVAGMGKTNAAHALTALLETRGADAVVGFGIGGAFPDSGLAPGEVALSTACAYGDEGVATPAGWVSPAGIGIPLWDDLHERFPADAAWAERTRAELARSGPAARTGLLLTVSCCSGTDALAAEMVRRFPGALGEGLEGAALAHVCAIYRVPFLEVRGISNRVEDRDLARWRVSEGAAAAQEGVRAALRSLPGA
jgi:futalosine hydrolase